MTARLSQGGRSQAVNLVRNQLTAYFQTFHPQILDGHNYYWYGWTEEEKTALELLQPSKHDPIETGSQVLVSCKSLIDKRDYLGSRTRIALRVGEGGYRGFKYPNVTINDDEIQDDGLRQKLLGWVVKAKYDKHLVECFEQYAQQLLYGRRPFETPVNTPGQLFRAWPQFASLIQSQYRGRVSMQTLRSAMPPGWLEEHYEEWLQQPYMEKINDALLALSLVEDDIKKDPGYPSLS